MAAEHRDSRVGRGRGWWWSLRHPLTLRAVTISMASLAGIVVTNHYQEQAWLQDKQFEMFRYVLDEGFQVMDDLSKTASRRLFGLNRVLWVARGTGTGELEQAWEAYYDSVIEWNVNVATYKSRLERFVDTETAEVFNNEQDAALIYSEGAPVSLHGQFMVAHQKVRALVDCVRTKCPSETRQVAQKNAQQLVNDLGVSVDGFLARCADAIYRRSGTEP